MKTIPETFGFRTSIFLFHIFNITVQARLITSNQFSEAATEEIRQQRPEPVPHTSLHFPVRGELTPPRMFLEFRKRVKVTWSQARAVWGTSNDLNV